MVPRIGHKVFIVLCFVASISIIGLSFNYWASSPNSVPQRAVENSEFEAISAEKFQNVRQVVLETAAECNVGVGTPCLPPFIKKHPMFLVSSSQKIAVCKVEKVMSTFLTAMMCYLNNPKKFRDAGRDLHTEVWSKRFCKQRIELHRIPTSKKNKQADLDQWNFAVVVREPISRFLSGFINKCVNEVDKGLKNRCYNCAKNMTCFAEKLYKNAVNYINSDEKIGLTYEAKHFFPQNWYCAFNEFPYNIIHYGTDGEGLKEMNRKIAQFLNNSNVTKDELVYIEAELNYKSPHANKNMTVSEMYERELWTNPRIMQKLIQLFYFDFALFGFPLPFGI